MDFIGICDCISDGFHKKETDSSLTKEKGDVCQATRVRKATKSHLEESFLQSFPPLGTMADSKHPNLTTTPSQPIMNNQPDVMFDMLRQLTQSNQSLLERIEKIEQQAVNPHQTTAMRGLPTRSQITDLGLPINPDKKTAPTRRLTCLGISIDLDTNTLSIEPNKLDEIYAECLQISTKTHLTRKKFQSLLEKLMYLHKIIKPARIFVNHILATFRNNLTERKIKLSKELFQNLNWLLTFLPSFNGISKIFNSPIPDNNQLFIDACLTGVGGIWGHRVYAAPIPQFQQDFHPSITHLEMLNLLVALRLWANHWAQSSVYIFCDNMAVVQVASSGRTRDPFCGACIRKIWFITATHDIDLEVKHIQGTKNVLADALSRIYSDKGISQDLFQMLKDSYTWYDIHHSLFHLSYLI